jgi:hypothetical protein
MKIKTSELSGVDLDRAVAHALGAPDDGNGLPCYSTDWGQGGPIIEREGICINSDVEGAGEDWVAHLPGRRDVNAPTPLIAAMRCYVSYKLGEELK